MKRLILIACALLPLGVLVGCSGSGGSSAAEAKLYDLKGKVVAVDRDAKSVKVDHEDVAGKMKAMVMTFYVDDVKLLDGLAAGDSIEAKFKDAGEKHVLTQVKKTASAPTAHAKEDEKTRIAANLAKLSPEDLKLAEAQKMCPVEDEPLGSMGVPQKIVLKGEPVFVCCKGCLKDIEKDADKILAKVAELKKKK
jgi:Cu/Ag efflux protein CusF